MTEPFTGTELCPKCGSADLTTSYNKVDNTLELQCRACNHRWPVLPKDTTV